MEEKRTRTASQKQKSFAFRFPCAPPPALVLLLVAAKWFYDLHPQCMGSFMVYISIYICVYAQIYVRGTFVYCASFVFVVNKLKMRPNWQRRHSICMRGVRGTLDRQPRLEELCAHGQHKRCFKQPPLPHPSLPPSLLSLSSNLSNTFTLRATSMDAFRIAKTLCGVSSYPKCLFPPSADFTCHCFRI